MIRSSTKCVDLSPERLEACLVAVIALKEKLGLHDNADVEAVWLKQILREWKAMRDILRSLTALDYGDDPYWWPSDRQALLNAARRELGE